MEFDVAALYWIREHLQFPSLSSFFEFLNDKRNYLLPGLAFIFLTVYLKKKKGLYYIFTALCTIIAADFIADKVLKPLFSRPRPCNELDFLAPVPVLVDAAKSKYIYLTEHGTPYICSSSWSFPSSTAVNLFVLATISFLFFRRSIYWALPLALVGSFMKLYQGAHYPTDVTGGAILGIALGIVGFKLAPKGWEPRQDLLPMIGHAASIKRILLIRLSSLGDVIQTLPALRTLKQLFPNARITWVVEERFSHILHNHPDLDEVMVVRTREWRRNWNLQTLKEIIHTVRELRNRKFDLALEIQGLIKTGVVAVLSGAPLQVGFDRRDCREPFNAWLTNIQVPFVGRQTHVVEKNLSMVQALGATILSKDYAIQIPPEAEQHAQKFLDSHPQLKDTPFVTLHLGVGYPTKQWSLDRFAQLGDLITRELRYSVVLTWGPGEEEQVQSLSSKMKEPHWVAPPNTLHQSMALFNKSRLFVGGDTGTLHLCVALGIPTVSLYGPTDPVYNGPYGAIHQVIFKELHCSFCYKRKCPTEHECMDGIQVDEVFRAVKSMIPGKANPALSPNNIKA